MSRAHKIRTSWPLDGQDSSSTGATHTGLCTTTHTANTATHCDTLHRTETLYLIRRCNTHCNTLQHTTTHCNTLQHTATHRNSSFVAATHRRTWTLYLCKRALWRSVSSHRSKPITVPRISGNLKSNRIQVGRWICEGISRPRPSSWVLRECCLCCKLPIASKPGSSPPCNHSESSHTSRVQANAGITDSSQKTRPSCQLLTESACSSIFWKDSARSGIVRENPGPWHGVLRTDSERGVPIPARRR